MGIGLGTYVEICGLGPSQVAGAIGFQGGLWESAIVRVHPTGKVQVFIGASPHGQGEETTFAQLVASEIGVDVNDVKVMHGDTDVTPMGWGTYGSRTTAVGGAALILATRKVKEKAKVVAAHLLEAAVEDMDYADGKFFVKGSPDKAKTIQDVALMANVSWNMPAGVEAGLEASMFYDPPNFTYPFGSHVAVVEIDPETGRVDLKRYVALDDCGPQINPVIVEGQVHGGVVQGIGQALWEEAVYDENGQLVTGSMTDYALPRADNLCDIEVISTVTPSPHHPLGLKGIGEAGTIASTVTVYNAVLDALAPLGVKSIQMPMTAERVWRAMQQSQPATGASSCTHQTSTTTGQARLRKRAICSRRIPARSSWRGAQPDSAAEVPAGGASRAHRHRPDRRAEGRDGEGRHGANRRAHDARRAGGVGGAARPLPGTCRGGAPGRGSGGQKPRHDRRQCRARRPGVRPADGPGRARRPLRRERRIRDDDRERQRFLQGHDDDGAWRARFAHGD